MDTEKKVPAITTEEEMLRFIMDNSHEMAQISDRKTWEMQYANRPAVEFANRSGSDYHGVPCYRYMMGLEAPCPFCPMLSMKGKTEAESEVDNGKQVYAVKTRILRWKGREAFLESVSDITELRRSRRIFESQMHMLLQSLTDATGVLHLDVTDDRCISKGGTIGVMKNLPQEKSIQDILDHVGNFIPDAEQRQGIYQTFSQKALLTAYEEGQIEIVKHMQSLASGKGLRDVRLTGRLLMNPANSHLECILYGRDVTEEIQAKKAEAEKDKEQLAIFYGLAKDFKNVFLLSPEEDKVNVLKLDGYVTPGLSQDMSITYPYRATTLRYIESRVYPADKERMKKAFDLDLVKQILRQSAEYTGTYRVQEAGKPCYFQFRFIRLEKENKVIMAFRNINELLEEEQKKRKILSQALKKAKQSNVAKTTFLNSMSHDIRTPLNAILGFTALAMNHMGQEDLLQDNLNKIALAGNHLLVLINDVLDMSRIESGKIELQEKIVYLPHLLEDMRTLMQTDASAKEQVLHWEVKELTHTHVVIDPMKLKKVLLNVLSNAVKFTKEGGCIRLSVKEEPETREGYALLAIQIKDSGIGMSPDYVEHIFEPFSREKTSTVSGIPGTGLGMAIAKHIMDMMGGTIEVESKLGKGSTVTIHLPCHLPQKSMKAPQEEQHAVPLITPKEGECRRILLVEDNELNQEIGKEILRLAGFEVDIAENGQVAYEKVAKAKPGQYHLVLMDIQMPVMDGYEATRKIRHLPESSQSEIPILALTANAFEEDKEKALRAGMNGHLVKPINIPDLLKAVRDI